MTDVDNDRGSIKPFVRRGARLRMYSVLVLAFGLLLASFVALRYSFDRSDMQEDLERSSEDMRIMAARQHILFVEGGSAAVCGLLLLGFCIAFERLQRRLEQQTTRLGSALNDLRRATSERESLQEKLLVASRQASMAEVATGVLHNVGNVLNSVNISANVIADKLDHSEVAALAQVGDLIREHQDDVVQFLTTDERGRLLPEFIVELGQCLRDEQDAMRRELDVLDRGVSHIKHVITMQQTYARRRSTCESVDPTSVMDVALEMQIDAFLADDVVIVRQYETHDPVLLDRHGVLQILLNLISNAKHAMRGREQADHQLVLSVSIGDGPTGPIVRYGVTDNGAGIATENLSRIFTLGFTTREAGHGFGLHTAATAAQEMRGSLTSASDGLGRGATFTLTVPIGEHTEEGHAADSPLEQAA